MGLQLCPLCKFLWLGFSGLTLVVLCGSVAFLRFSSLMLALLGLLVKFAFRCFCPVVALVCFSIGSPGKKERNFSLTVASNSKHRTIYQGSAVA